MLFLLYILQRALPIIVLFCLCLIHCKLRQCHRHCRCLRLSHIRYFRQSSSVD